MKQVKPLTARELVTYKPPKLPHKLPDGDGLFLCFLASGLKVWRYRVRIPQKDSWFTLGYFPEMSLAQARRARDEAKRQVKAEGITPAQSKKAAKESEQPARTFEEVARAWIASKTPHATPRNIATLKRLLSMHLAPVIGDRDITTLKKAELLEAAMIPLSLNEPKRSIPLRLVSFIGMVFEHARLYEIIPDSHFPDAHLSKLLPKAPTAIKHHACLIEPREIGKLLRSLDRWYLRCQVVQVGLALRLVPYVFLRSSELIGGLWSEIDFDSKLWTISAERMKMTRPHIVPLSRQALEILEEAKAYAGDSPFIFPSKLTKSGHINGSSLLNALQMLGWDTGEEQCVHGFRGMFTTIANEGGYSRDAIELQMSHVERNAVRAAYNRASYMPERKAMMQDYADYLDTLRSGEMHTMQEWRQKRQASE